MADSTPEETEVPVTIEAEPAAEPVEAAPEADEEAAPPRAATPPPPPVSAWAKPIIKSKLPEVSTEEVYLLSYCYSSALAYAS